MDSMASKEDVLDAFRKVAAEGDCIGCRILRMGLLGMQVAMGACSAQLARKIAAQNEDGVVSKVKVVLKVTRCYACHDFGHMAARCPINKTDSGNGDLQEVWEHSIRE